MIIYVQSRAEFVRLQPVLVILLSSRCVSSTNLKFARSQDLATLSEKSKVVKESNFSQSESQLLCITVSNGSKYNSVSLNN